MLQQVGKLFNSCCYHLIIYRAGSLTPMLAESYDQLGIVQVQVNVPEDCKLLT
jgi:hypothetical protein